MSTCTKVQVLCFEDLEFANVLEYSFSPFEPRKGKLGFKHPLPKTTHLQTLQATEGLGLGLWQCSLNLREQNKMKLRCLPASTLQAPKDNLLAGRENNLLFLNPLGSSLSQSLFYETKAVIQQKKHFSKMGCLVTGNSSPAQMLYLGAAIGAHAPLFCVRL